MLLYIARSVSRLHLQCAVRKAIVYPNTTAFLLAATMSLYTDVFQDPWVWKSQPQVKCV